MRHLLFLPLLFLLTAAGAQSECTALFRWLQPPTALTYTDYNRKGKATGTSTLEVIQLRTVPAGTRADLRITFDDEDLQDYEITYGITCAADKLIIDMSSLLNPAVLRGFASLETEIDYEEIELPARLEPGQRLNDGSVTVRSAMTGAPGLGVTMTIETENRRVAARETVTTPAGTFDTTKVTYDQRVTMLGTRQFGVAEWWNPQVGLVKSVTYGKNGKQQRAHVLTAIE